MFGISKGQEEVAKKFSAAVWDFIADTPFRRRDDVMVYERTAPDRDEMAEAAAAEERSKVRRAEQDPDYAVAWARRVTRNREMDNPWHRLNYEQKLASAKEQDYQDALKRYRSLVSDGRFEKVNSPMKSLRPDEHRAWLQVQGEWLASLEVEPVAT